MLRRLVVVLVAAAMAATSCSSDGAAERDASAPSAEDPEGAAEAAAERETEEAELVASFREPGPYEVGITTIATEPGGLPLIEVLYPATDDAAGATDAYRVREFLPEALQTVIPEDADDQYSVAAARDAEVADGEFPVVLFSHGFSAFRTQSQEILRHLASWGMVIASPDHASRWLPSQLGAASDDAPEGVVDLRTAERMLAVANTSEGHLLEGVADMSRIALVGHSAGGGTVAARAQDDGEAVLGYVMYAAGARDEVELADVPSLYLAGALDEVVTPDVSRNGFEQAADPSWLWTIDGAGHLAFSDLCVIGEDDGGLLGLADAAGIRDAVPENLERLATDGCEPPNEPVETVWPAILQSTTGFLRYVFGDDSEPLGLDEFASDTVSVSIESH